MKIICIGHNYTAHNEEMKSSHAQPAIFMKPETALAKNGSDIYIPDFTNDFQHEIELVLRICKVGKSISQQFASRYYDAIGLGIDFTARDVQRKCKEKGEPWEIAKAFDFSAPVSTHFLPVNTFSDLHNIDFSLTKNTTVVQSGNSRDMILYFDEIIAYISLYFTLKIGDLIFTGTPAGVGKVVNGDVLHGFMGSQELLTVQIC